MAESVIKAQLTDVGTRWKHLSDLLEGWELAVNIIEDYGFHSEVDRIRLNQLKGGIALLRKQIESMSNYQEKQWSLRDQVNKIALMVKNKKEGSSV